MTIIGYVKDWLQGCESFTGERLDIDYLASSNGSYAVSSIPTDRIIKKYMDGSTVRRQLIAVSSRTFYGSELEQQEANIAVFESLEAWIDDQNWRGLLPALGEKRTARAVNVLSSAYPIEVDDGAEGSLARYQIQIELEYLQEV